MPDQSRVTIFEVAERAWGWLMTSAEADDRVYVGSLKWHQRNHTNAGSDQYQRRQQSE